MKFSPGKEIARSSFSFFAFLLFLSTLVVTSLLTGCNAVSTASPGSGQSAAQSNLFVAPTAINFGTVQSSSKATSLFQVTNAGKSVEIIESASITPTPTFAVPGWSGRVVLSPGQRVQLRTTFAPRSVGNYFGTLTLVTATSVLIESPRRPAVGGPARRLYHQHQVNVPVFGAATAANGLSSGSGGSGGSSGSGNPSSGSGVNSGSAGGGNSGSGSSATQIVVSVSPGSAAMGSGQSKQFTASVLGSSNTSVSWSAVYGSISSSGVYTAPNVGSQITDTVSAVSVADATNYASASIIVFPVRPSLNTYYVDPINGNDSNDGTSQSSAWLTLCKTNSSATLGANGTIINLLPGPFNLSAQGSCYSNGALVLSGLNGTPSQRVRWMGQNDPRSNSNSTVLNGANSANMYVSNNYNDFIQLELTGGIIEFGSNDDNPSNGNNDSLQKSFLHDAYTTCSTLVVGIGGFFLTSRTSQGGLVDSNVVNNIGVPGGCAGEVGTGPHGIYIAGYHYQVTNNLVSNAEGYGIHSYHDGCESEISNNTVVHNYAGGIIVSAGPQTDLGCGNNAGNWYTVDNNLAAYNGWGCGVITAAGNAGVQGGMIVYDTGSGAVNNVGDNNYLISNWSYTGNASCTNALGSNNAFIYACDSGSPSCPDGQFLGDPASTFSATSMPGNALVNPCPASSWGSTACSVVPVARGGTYDWHVLQGGPLDGAGGNGCAGSPGFAAPCIPALDADGLLRNNPTSIGAYEAN